ncbi:hypothetical protein KC332_g8474 [Hortaea werneckii]|nr:hypothetical protein KC358_g12830 [Hortaea werneckii]KAI6852198.1 hypothetical protein KC350_g1108 [Hortaea werneckii]KAI6943825.1 hypothetical protein KC341_g1245 [Hortaea werneckii]KAI6949513.1 hypothetical protein KC348_g1282 [Hortaea werneckii]KAI6964922.1 hypothetical protein KC321_g10390 [Hortaea werneckii]
MNFFSPPPTITAKVHATLPDSLICREPSEWTGGFAGGYNDVFLEGPTVGTSDSVFVTDIPHGRILEVDEQGKFTECLKYDGEPNGMAVRKDGKFVVADYKQGMLLFDPETRTMSPLVTRWNLERFKGPNDVIVDSKENVYFTDQGQTSMTDQTGRVYRLCPDGRLDTLLTNGISPNGLVLSPDEKYLSITAQSPIDFWGVLSNVKLLDVGMDAREGLHACKRCRARKVKCDKIAPSCSPCAKAGVHCVFIDGNSHVEYSRAEIARLEDEERSLRATFQNSASENVTSPHSAEPSPAFVGESSGISSRLGESRGQVLKQLLKRPQQQAPAIAPANFPCFEAADYLVRTYLGESHLQKPFLLEGEVYELLSRIYPSRGDSLASDEDRFRLLMICAIAAVRLHRRGIVDVHPFAFFQAARKYFAKIPLLAGLASIQNLLLLARFGMSTWEIARLLIRICVEEELHLEPILPIQPLHEQHRRRIFWECYVLDRHSSVTLGRPFAIEDSDIRIGLPVSAHDKDLSSLAPGRLDVVKTLTFEEDRAMKIFIHFVRLRLITSRIHNAFFSSQSTMEAKKCSVLDVGRTLVEYHSLLAELERWRQAVPTFPQSESLYQRPKWYDFLFEKEVLLLVRGALDAVPSNLGWPPPELAERCRTAAARAITLYSEMYAARHINCTRGYFQTIFTAGLTLVHFAPKGQSMGQRARHPQLEVLNQCAHVLWSLCEIMTDARPFAQAFQVVCEHLTPQRDLFAQCSNTQNDPSYSTDDIAGQYGVTANNNSTMLSSDSLFTDFPTGNSIDSFDWSAGWPTDLDPLMSDMELFAGQFACGDLSFDLPQGDINWNFADGL